MMRYATTQFRKHPLEFGQSTTSAQEDALLLVMEMLRLPADDPDPWLDASLTQAEKEAILLGVQTRVDQRRPVAYIVKTAYFHGEPVFVDERVLIPRSYLGEVLVSERYRPLLHGRPVTKVLDLCTGSGCLAILASRVFPKAELIHATDISPDCIEVATKNIRSRGLEDRILPMQGDLFDFPQATRYDLILCNPPYVDHEGMASLPMEYRFEPKSALAAGEDGMAVLRRILIESPGFLTDQGILLCEVGLRAHDVLRMFPMLEGRVDWLDTELSENEVLLARKSVLEEACSKISS